jgi:hypothetical protein
MRYLVLAATLLAPLLGYPQVYKWTQPDGSVVYSDSPQPGAEVLDLPPINVYAPGIPPDATAASTAPAEPATAPAEAPAQPYTQFGIVTPAQGATIQNTAYTVDVTLALEPPLQAEQGHGIVLLLDGQSVTEPGAQLAFKLNPVYRGEHTLQAQVVDANGAVLAATESVIFYVHQASRLMPSPLNPPNRPR